MARTGGAVVRGLDELRKELNDLPAKLARNVVGSGNRAVANALVKEIRSQGGNVPDTVIKAVMAQPSKSGRITRAFVVGLRKPFSSMSHWFEYGTGPRTQKKTGRYTGRMPATPWLRPALEAIGPKAKDIWAKAASRNLDRQLKKLGK